MARGKYQLLSSKNLLELWPGGKKEAQLDTEEEDDESQTPQSLQPSPRATAITKLQIFLVSLHLCIFIGTVSLYAASRNSPTHLNENQRAQSDPNPMFSPAQEAIQYERAVLFGPLKDLDATLYSGAPNDQKNAAWEKLLAVGIVDIDSATAARLEDPSMELKDRPGHVKVGLDVFHQLHCLYNLRKMVYPEYPWETYGESTEHGLHQHTDHCIEYLRQTIMCNSNVNTISWRWNATAETAQPDVRISQSCRDFSKIYDWAASHAAGGKALPSFQEAGLQPLIKGGAPCPEVEYCEP